MCTSRTKGKSVVIDRQNFDVSQRYTWLEIGQQHNVEVVALVFQTSQAVIAHLTPSHSYIGLRCCVFRFLPVRLAPVDFGCEQIMKP